MCLTHHKGKCYQCAFEKLCDGKATIANCETMKKTQFDQRVAEKTKHIQEKIDEIIAHIIDKQNYFIDFIELDPRRSVDEALDQGSKSRQKSCTIFTTKSLSCTTI